MIYLENEAATEAFGARLASACKLQGLITLSGDLGSGKTTLSRGLIRAAGHTGPVKSPTFTLLEPYELDTGRIMHFDLYRMTDPEELEYIGFRDYLDAHTLCLIEWPEKAAGVLPEADLELNLGISGTGRQISWIAHTAHGRSIADALNQAL